ncbi:amidase [Kribbella voronezhensis]|uniref:amidase n=1 Tax=Kribbella voronezhensis TaxID=2512212 RepID=UPI001062ED07|nr:amidase [Kribbella voronezhensis]
MESIEAIAASVRSGAVDPVDLVEQALRRAEETAALNAVVHLDAEGARKAAAAHDRRGALAGIPVLVKEIIEVEGLPYRCGSLTMDEVGSTDADVVRRLRAAGAIVLGLSHSHEFAYGCTGTSNRAGPCHNPHDPSRITGGSSAGAAAAVAAGVVPLAIGTDTAGSVRIPAALCGVVGFKPARNTLSTDRVFPLSQSLDHVGVLTATVADAQYAVDALTAQHTARTASPPRLGLVSNPEHLDCSPEVTIAWSAAIATLRAAGAVMSEAKVPDWAETNQTAIDLQGPEAVANHVGRDVDNYQPDVQQRLREAAEIPAWRYVRAREQVLAVTVELGTTISRVDALLLPTVQLTAPTLSEVENDSLSIRAKLLRNTRLANLTGYPAYSVPLPTDGLPVGLQVIALDNQSASAVAHWVEQALTSRPQAVDGRSSGADQL